MANVFPVPELKLWVGCNHMYGADLNRPADGLLQIKLGKSSTVVRPGLERVLGGPSIPREGKYIARIAMDDRNPLSFTFEIPLTEMTKWTLGIQGLFGADVARASRGIAAIVLNEGLVTESQLTATQFDVIDDLTTGELAIKLRALRDAIATGRGSEFEDLVGIIQPKSFRVPSQLEIRLTPDENRTDGTATLQVSNLNAGLPQHSYVSREALGAKLKLGITNPHLVHITAPWIIGKDTPQARATRDVTNGILSVVLGEPNAAQVVKRVRQLRAEGGSISFIPDALELARHSSAVSDAFLDGGELGIAGSLNIEWLMRVGNLGNAG